MNDLITIVVPVYNVERYVEKCLDSIIKQTYQNIEVLVINDGSTDNSLEIIKEFSKRDNRVLIFTKENGGLSDARNYGLDRAQGKYILFIDSDDYIESDMVNKMYSEALMNDADLVYCDIKYVFENESSPPFIVTGFRQNIEGDSVVKGLLSVPSAWNKLYKKSLFDQTDVRYPNGLWYEDIPTTFRLLPTIKKIGYVNEPFVNYLQRDGSIMSSKYDDRMLHIYEVFNIVNTYYKEIDIFDKYYVELEFAFIEHIILYGTNRFLRVPTGSKLIHRSLMDASIMFPKWKHNKYLKLLSKHDQIFLKILSKYTVFLYVLYVKTKDMMNR